MATTPPARTIVKPPPPGYTGQKKGSQASGGSFDALGGASRARQGGRGTAGHPSGIRYPDWFRTLSDMDQPEDLSKLFSACRYLSKWSPVHKAFISAMSTFPITNIIIKPSGGVSEVMRDPDRAEGRTAGRGGDDKATAKVQSLVDRHWKLKKFNREVARSRYTYTNAVVGISFPFQKMLRCTSCGVAEAAEDSEWELRKGGQFHWVCPSCGHRGEAEVWDHWLDVPEDIQPLLFDVERIDSLKNEFRGTVEFYYRLSENMIQRLKATGSKRDKTLICSTPQAYLEAALGKRFSFFSDDVPRVKLVRDQVYHLRGTSLPEEQDTGLAFPEAAATLQDYWLYTLLRRSQETVASEFIIPVRTMFPQPSGTSGNLFEMINVSNYMGVMKEQYKAFKRDPGSMMFLPFPIGHQTVGGEAKALMLSQEIRVVMEVMVAGLGAPLEFIFGGLSYSGSNVSIKQQEVKIEDFREDLLDMNVWFYERVRMHMSQLPDVHLEHAPFRMGDDMQQVQMLMAMKGQNLASSRRVHAEMGWDTHTERQQIRDDLLFESELQKERMKVEAQTQQDMMLRQMASQSEGQVRGMESMIEARLEFQKKLRSDEELMGLVLKDPGLAMQIFGANSMEIQNLHAAGVQPQSPDPEESAPQGKKQEGQGLTLQIQSPGKPDERLGVGAKNAPAAAAVATGSDYDEMIPRLVSAFGQVPRANWPEILGQISTSMGPEVAKRVSSKLEHAKIMADRDPDLLPARRSLGG